MWQANKGIIIGLIVGLVIGYIVGASWGGSSRVQEKSDSGTEKEAQEPVASDETISISDQVAGQLVTVSGLTTSEPTWVAVREDNNGVGGDILGATLLPISGVQSDVGVDLLVPTVSGDKYHINLYIDDGDQIFDNRLDSLLENDVIFNVI
ncbi:hypothetical protein IT398_02290 [Candidatus Nomurabacteria bacterium]|nr:hypothetical protein [Candidatus Nomurabacteria bacterium]